MANIINKYLNFLGKFLILILLVFSGLLLAQEDCKKYDGMEASPGMCAMMPDMCGCQQTNPKSEERLRIGHFNPFPSSTPGIEQYEKLGYCTGNYMEATYSYSYNNPGKKIQSGGNIRKYTLTITNRVEPTTNRKFMLIQNLNSNGMPCAHLGHAKEKEAKEFNSKQRPVNAPPLFFIEGETAEITVINNADTPTSVHWHGLILPNDQDGIVGITQMPIPSHGKKVYSFPLKQNGTYWYHPHDLNEQDTKGSFIIFPKPGKEIITRPFGKIETRYHHDRVIMLTDYKKRDTLLVLNQLRNDQNALEIDNKIHKGFLNNISCLPEYLKNLKTMKMFWMDKADIWYDAFFINDETCLNCGKHAGNLENPLRETPKQNFSSVSEFNDIKPGDRVRLRIVNSSASSYFYIDYGNNQSLNPNEKTDMLVVAKDGQPIEPTYTDQLYMGMGETYDVIVEVPESGTLYELRAKSIDDQNSMRMARVLIGSEGNFTTNIVQARNVPVQICGPYSKEQDATSQISYSDMNARTETPDPVLPYSGKPIERYNLDLSGSMEDYHWKIKGIKGTVLKNDSGGMPYLTITEDSRVRITIRNNMTMGMMNHPWHLHGNFFRIIDNGDTDDIIAKKPLFHTATIFPGQEVELEIYADPAFRGAWMFHCHNLFHMANDMMMYLKYNTIKGDVMTNMMNMNHTSMQSNHPNQMDIKSGTILDGMKNMKNQYVTVGGGVHGGTSNFGPDAQVNYRGTFGNNAGFVNLHADLSSDFDNKNQEGRIVGKTKTRYCFEVNKCVNLDLSFKKALAGKLNDIDATVDGEYKVFNSDLFVLNSGAGVKCVDENNIGKLDCLPAFKMSTSSSVDMGWNTKVTVEAGCEGAYCSEAYAALNIKIRANSRITIIPLDCKISSNAEETACFASVDFSTNPMPIGYSGH
ncbi:MAG: multicopper oxidase family protein [Bacteriovorax sp.]|nr:multicopper oxidase family protein [Bacteriovorax sp.]